MKTLNPRIAIVLISIASMLISPAAVSFSASPSEIDHQTNNPLT